MSVPKSTVCQQAGRESLRFLYLRFCEVSDLFSCPPCSAREHEERSYREPGTRSNGKWRNGWRRDERKGRQRGEGNLQRLALSRRGCSFFLPLFSPFLAPNCAHGDFSFFGTRPSLCLFQYALLTLHRPLAPVTELHFSTWHFLILFFLLLSRNRLMREHPKQPFEKERATTICRELSAPLRSCLLFTSHRLVNVLGTIFLPRFALADLPLMVRRRSS